MLFTPTPKFATIRTRRPPAARSPASTRSVTAQSSPSASRIARASPSRESGSSSGFSSASNSRAARASTASGSLRVTTTRGPAIQIPSTMTSVQVAAPCRIALNG